MPYMSYMVNKTAVSSAFQPNFLTTELTEKKQRAQRFFYHEEHEET